MNQAGEETEEAQRGSEAAEAPLGGIVAHAARKKNRTAIVNAQRSKDASL
eukprot:CAMPEP_0206615912 /NCGR_PEP_ID=MMETSP0325_2-20121206/58616_1 /ASSEMBLY_ACC=CAM_ASM_000347 /TAXON_ID=2866 /ORGANISM="Crypthecodinium cohnii, Strain Seligo" /LENGTH=49 /DNA_ID= /DNA_START= /DNA_END= /DNA_ORIENTATION=